jgi:predicted ATP-binding protein involved in virulence
MYIKRIVLKNIRCFENLEISFDKNGQSALILGDNGDGKSTLLKSLAMGLCDESSAAGLQRELPGELVRKSSKRGMIILELEGKKGKYKIQTSIKSLKAFERVQQTVYLNGKKSNQNLFPWQDIFVCGYGPGRQTKGTDDLDEYIAIDAVYTLFRYYEPLQNPELAVWRLVEKARRRAGSDREKQADYAKQMLEQIRELLKHVLNLDQKDEVFITPTGIEIKGHWGRNKLSTLGDGYRATVTWVMDFLSWRMLSGKSLDPLTMSGIVLVDEIEQHLHPRWQINIMKLLQEAFPRIQFIATTHSPLVASGSEHCAVYALKQGQKEIIKSVYGWLAEDVYYEMGLTAGSRPPDFQNKVLNEFKKLSLKKIKGTASKYENKRLSGLRKKLMYLPEGDPIALTSEINNITTFLKEIKT